MKNSVIILFISLAWFSISSCQKDGNNQNQSSNHNDTAKTLPRSVVSISQTPVTILLPNNCEQQFTITNSGVEGSTLNYTVKDDGALQGYLNITNPSGLLSAGASATIFVNVKSDFVNDAGLIDAVLVLNVYTPNASNFKRIPVPVNIKSNLGIAPLFTGTWSGTWSGGTNYMPTGSSTPVSGTWSLNLKMIDTANKTFTGSLTWIGTDAYWTVVINSAGQITSAISNTVPINEVIPLDASNTTFSAWQAPNGCNQSELWLIINPNLLSGTSGSYGPFFDAIFDIGSKTIITGESEFTTHPSVDDESSGTIIGAKK